MPVDIRSAPMPKKKTEDYQKRHDPYDPLTGATGNDEPSETADKAADEVETDGKELGG
jgi:hypothetical protein